MPDVSLICDYPPCSKPFTLNASMYRRRQKFCPRSYCSTTCSAKDRKRHYPLKSLEERFWANVAVCEHGRACRDCCWPWQGWTRAGYGKMYVLERDGDIGAPAIARFLKTGIWPTLDMCHTCDNPPCVNDAHLFEGTAVDNARDMVRKRRHSSMTHPASIARGDRNGARTHPETLARGDDHWTHRLPERLRRGAANNFTKLTEAQRAAIPHLYHDEGWTMTRIAEEFGVTRQAIRFHLNHDQ
jgi:hypothetical protein